MGNTGSFAQYRLDLMDPRNGGPEGEAWAQTWGELQDDELTLLRTAMLCRLPSLCPADALDHIGPGAFGLERMPAQIDDDYRTALVQAAQTYATAGSAQAVIDQLTAYAGGSLDVQILRDCDGQTSYPSAWYSRFDVELGPNFGSLAIQRPIISPLLATTTAAFSMPAVNGFVHVLVDDNSGIAFGDVIFIGQAGYFQVNASGGGSIVITNLGGAAQAGAAIGLLPGTLDAADGGAYLNTDPPTTIPAGQRIVIAASSASDGPNTSVSMIIGQSLIGIQFAVPAQRRAVKSMILRWKAAHGYAGRIQLLWVKQFVYPSDDAAAGFFWNYTYLGNMIGINMTIGVSPDNSGYDRS